MPTSQALALFAKMMVRISKQLEDIQRDAISAELPERQQVVRNVAGGSGQQGTDNWQPMATTVEEDLEEVVDEETKKQRARQRELIDSMDLSKYAIDGGADFSEAQARVEALANAAPEQKARMSTVMSVKAAAPAAVPESKQKRKGDTLDKSSKKGKKSRA